MALSKLSSVHLFLENPRRSLDRSVSLADVDAIKRKWLATPADGREEFTQEHGALVKQIREVWLHSFPLMDTHTSL